MKCHKWMIAGCLILLLAAFYVPAFQGANSGLLLAGLMFACCVLPMVLMNRKAGAHGSCCGGHKTDAVKKAEKASCH